MKNNVPINIMLFVLLLLIMAGSLFIGKVNVPFSEWLSGDLNSLIITELRAPRTIIGAIIGAGLGMSGAAMQGYLRNPLADPGIFGVSSSAALGAVASLFFGYTASVYILPFFALGGAAIGMALLALLAGRQGSLIMFTLAGIIISSLTGALTSLLISLAPNPFVSGEIVKWLMGALTDRSWDDVKIALPLVIIGMGVLTFSGKSLDALTLGENTAKSMGVNMPQLQWILIIGVGLCVGASVAVAGIIGFVGLVVPHLMRPFVGHKPSSVLLPSALAGAILVVAADCLVRSLPSITELRLGIAMSLLGAPFFLMLLFKMRRNII